MDTAAQRYAFAPPPTPGLLRGLALAILAHLLLLAGLAVGVNWKTDTTLVTAEAELWSAVPQQAAPRLVEAPPPLPLTPVVTAPESPPVARVSDADIAAERDKQRKLKQDEDARVLAQQNEKARKLAETQKLAQQKVDKLKQDKLALDKKKAQEQQAALDKQKAEQDAKRKLEQKSKDDTKAEQARRADVMSRIAGLAGATGGPSAAGTALQSSGPSASYNSRILSKVKPNIVFTEDIPGNPQTIVEVSTSPDGTIIKRKLIKSSGSSAWDDAVLRALEKTESLPRDADGRVPTPLEIGFRPKDKP